jgi:activator of HSP90 ATPase
LVSGNRVPDAELFQIRISKFVHGAVAVSTQKTKTIKQTTFIPAKPLEVYNTFLTAKGHAAFTGAKATCQAKVGGRFTAYDGYIWGTILVLDEGSKIVQEWQTTEWPPEAPPSIADFSFKDKNGGTELTMVHSEVPADQADDYRQGWIDYYWNPLKEYFEQRSH